MVSKNCFVVSEFYPNGGKPCGCAVSVFFFFFFFFWGGGGGGVTWLQRPFVSSSGVEINRIHGSLLVELTYLRILITQSGGSGGGQSIHYSPQYFF